MATLYLHIGHGKTGTSWIQSCFRSSVNELKKHDIVYAKGADSYLANPNMISSGNANSLLESRSSFESNLAKSPIQNGNSLLFSSEDLFKQITEKNVQDFIEAVASDYGFDRIKILLFIRNPIRTVVSAWQQRIKRLGFHHISITDLHEHAGMCGGKVLRVERLLDYVEKSHSIDLTVRNYSRCKDNLIGEVAQWLNVPEEIF